MRFQFRLAVLTFLLAVSLAAREHRVLLGTYTGDSRGIYSARLDAATGALSAPELVAEIAHPEFLALHPDGHVVYALTRVEAADGKVAGAVAAYALDLASGKLTHLNTQSTGRTQLCHLAVDATGRMVIVASYGGGYVASFPLATDGRIEPVASILPHSGPTGPKADRQDAPHAHSVTLSPDNRFAFVADLGLDRVLAYRLEPARGTLTPHEPAFVSVPPGVGPRHSKFSPDGKNFYILNELGGTVTVCRYDAVLGVAEPSQHAFTFPDGYTGRISTSEVRVHPTGRFVYTANRVHNSIAVFARDPAAGTLTRVEIVPCGGKTPRNFNLSPDGAWLLCANQESDDLTVFRVDAATGRLTPTGPTVAAAKVVCVLFLPGEPSPHPSALEVVSIATGERQVVHRARHKLEAPHFSPDGHALYFNGLGRVQRLALQPSAAPAPIDTGFARRNINDHGISPDGTQLVISDLTESGRSLMYLLPLGGGDPQRVAVEAPAYWHGWSPDGKTLTYCAARDGNYDVYTVPVAGGPEVRLTTAPGNDNGSDYTPDGRWIYFHSNRTGRFQIWRMHPDGSNQVQVTEDDWFNWFPHPSPDGKWIAILSSKVVPDTGHPPDGEYVLRLLSAAGGPVRELGRFQGGNGSFNVPCWSPDSTQLAFASYGPDR